MQLSLAAVTIRLGAYIFMTEPYQILWVEWLHGPMFGLMWAAGTQLCRQLSPPGMESSMQAFLSCLVFGLGSLAGNTFGGFMSEIYTLPFLIGVCIVPTHLETSFPPFKSHSLGGTF